MSQGFVQERSQATWCSQWREQRAVKTTAWPTLSLDAPKRPEWGDLASVAMSLASSEHKAPHDIAQIIVENIQRSSCLIVLKCSSRFLEFDG